MHLYGLYLHNPRTHTHTHAHAAHTHIPVTVAMTNMKGTGSNSPRQDSNVRPTRIRSKRAPLPTHLSENLRVCVHTLALGACIHCMYVCMHVCLYVYMFICIHVYNVHMYTHTYA